MRILYTVYMYMYFGSVRVSFCTWRASARVLFVQYIARSCKCTCPFADRARQGRDGGAGVQSSARSVLVSVDANELQRGRWKASLAGSRPWARHQVSADYSSWSNLSVLEIDWKFQTYNYMYVCIIPIKPLSFNTRICLVTVFLCTTYSMCFFSSFIDPSVNRHKMVQCFVNNRFNRPKLYFVWCICTCMTVCVFLTQLVFALFKLYHVTLLLYTKFLTIISKSQLEIKRTIPTSHYFNFVIFGKNSLFVFFTSILRDF